LKNSTESNGKLEKRRVADLFKIIDVIQNTPLGNNREKKLAGVHRRMTVPHLKLFSRPVAPERYADLPSDDLELLEIIMQAKGKSQEDLAKETKRLLKLFGQWRGDVLLCEARARGSIEHLLRAAMHCQLSGDEDKAYELLIFACTEYGFHASSPPTNNEDIQRLAERHSRYPDVLSDVLLYEDRKGGKKKVVESTQIEWKEILDEW